MTDDRESASVEFTEEQGGQSTGSDLYGGCASLDEKIKSAQVNLLLKEILQKSVLPELCGRDLSAPPGEPYQSRARAEDAAFQKLVLSDDLEGCVEFVSAKTSQESWRQVCLGMFTTAAREFGKQWERDELDFVEVTIAMTKLHCMLNHLAQDKPEFEPEQEIASIALASADTEQHSFGLFIVSKFFQLEGWHVVGGPQLQIGEDVEDLVHDMWFDVIGISAATDSKASELRSAIQKIRLASSNSSISVLVGGKSFTDNPELHRIIGADDVASDAQDAVVKVRGILRRRALEQR